MSEGYSGLSTDRFQDVEKAREKYALYTRDSLFAPQLDLDLLENGIAIIEMPLSDSDFEVLLKGYEVCIQEIPEILSQTRHKVDSRFGNEAGHERKLRKISRTTNRQIQDPKNLIHFNEMARIRWEQEFADGPKILKSFLTDGYEIHNALIQLAKTQFEILEETHPGITKSHFPGSPGTTNASYSHMRLLRYDGYEFEEDLGEVAKPHFDISGATIQAYADAPGFWGAKDGRDGERTHFDTAVDEAFLFMGRGYDKLYGDNSRYKPLWHGVDRIIPDGETIVDPRHAVILFVDAPFIDYGVTAEDTLPYLNEVSSVETSESFEKTA